MAHAGRLAAALTPRLLARKGAARPAMRNPLALTEDAAAADLDDLGWNDMGFDHDHSDKRVVDFARESIIRAPATRRAAGSRLKQGGTAAFTLRLDAERHRRLHLAATLEARSAQSVVTEALDRLLAEKPELEALARARVVRPASRRPS